MFSLRVLLFTLTHRHVREGGPHQYVIIGPAECLLSLLTDGGVRQAYLPKWTACGKKKKHVKIHLVTEYA